MPAQTRTNTGFTVAKRPLRTLLVDNYDSYTLNLLQLLGQQQLAAGGEEEKSSVLDNVLVIRNDQYAWTTVRDTILPFVDNVVISPGPGHPSRKADFGVCGELILAAHKTGLPVLGVCLGHQGIATAFGGQVRQCKVAVHGQTSAVQQIEGPVSDEPGLFDGVPDLFRVVRYHSLAVSEAGNEFPSELRVLARAVGSVKALDAETGRELEVESREIMALRHVTSPLFGVQFHPESVCSEHGAMIMQNFGAISRFHQKARQSFVGLPREVAAMSLLALDSRRWRHLGGGLGLRLAYETVDLGGDVVDSVGLFTCLYGDDCAPVWLDSADGRGMSVMASAQTAGSLTVRYSVGDRRVAVVRLTGANSSEAVYETVLESDIEFWTWMQGVVDSTQVGNSAEGVGFQCGWIGYFGYEMKGANDSTPAQPTGDVECRLPDAQLAFVDRCVVIDHDHSPPRAYVLAVVSPPASHSPPWMGELGFRSHNEAVCWIKQQAARIKSRTASRRPKQATRESSSTVLGLAPDMAGDEYVAAIGRAKQWIAQGESYEVCLTTQFRADLSKRPVGSARDMLGLYTSMRSHSAPPYGALLWTGDTRMGVASCSPERFLSTTHGRSGDRWVEMKPIKGTCRRAPRPTTHSVDEWARDDALRAQSLLNDAKERAENLMIVDLIRHDLAWISSNVQVPQLMAIESFQGVHQMVTTVRGRLHLSVGDVAALAHCFPPGSMTGAPKKRTVRLLDQLEGGRRRGVYSGCLGYFSAHGVADWSVVIRTAVVDQQGRRLSVGAGGALTILSGPEKEWAEVETKLQSVLPGISQYIK
ncbi:para-aminobenzoate synthase, (PABA) [Coemansia sp. BCRC 34301]|nr:para-aminobenzoate synthase, (PABA) [Coemansia sp. BCRC 34301]